MRRGTSQHILATKKRNKGKKGGFFGVALGSDACAEHETGFRNLWSAFQVPKRFEDTQEVGLDARKITTLPKGLFFREDNGYTLLVYTPYERYQQMETKELVKYCELQTFSHFITRSPHATEPAPFTGAWDSCSFGIATEDPTFAKELKKLWEAFQRLDIVLMGQSTEFMQMNGLGICIYSKVPLPIREELAQKDNEKLRLAKAVRKSDIEKVKQELANADKDWFALSPRFTSDGKLAFWLNPRDQKNNHMGLFTIDELRQWAKNKGPIPVKKLSA